MSKVTTRREANGTYTYILDGVETPTTATMAIGARVQGLRMAAWMEEFSRSSRANYQPTDVTLNG